MSKISELCDWVIKANELCDPAPPSVKIAKAAKVMEQSLALIERTNACDYEYRKWAKDTMAEVEKILNE